ncbi:MAG: TIGR02391 family protein, partial [Chloroflexota bacterium]|nr:TIGR02391 family protein [Chloroflexota bacterium]
RQHRADRSDIRKYGETPVWEMSNLQHEVRQLVGRLHALNAQLQQQDGIAGPPASPVVPTRLSVDAVVSDADLLVAVAGLYEDGHYSQAVFEAFKFVGNLVKSESREPSRDGAKLMYRVFSEDKPILALSDLATESGKNEQAGYMQIFAGVMTGIRNPRAHESGWTDSKSDALRLLSLADHLVMKIRSASKV